MINLKEFSSSDYETARRFFYEYLEEAEGSAVVDAELQGAWLRYEPRSELYDPSVNRRLFKRSEAFGDAHYAPHAAAANPEKWDTYLLDPDHWVLDREAMWTGIRWRDPGRVIRRRNNPDDDNRMARDFVEHVLEVDTESSVTTTEVYEAMNEWLMEQSRLPWSDQKVKRLLAATDPVARGEVKAKRVVRGRPSGRGIDLRGPEAPISLRPSVWAGWRWKR